MNPYSAYAQAQCETATPERQMVILFEAAMARIRAGVFALESGRKAEASKSLLSASKIVNGLLATLRPSVAPELCKSLAPVYTFVCQRLIQASLKHDLGLAHEAEKVFEPVASAFVTAAAQVAARR